MAIGPGRDEIVRAEETVRFSGGGIAALVFLILWQVIVLLMLVVTNGAIQQAAVAAMWTAGNVALCTGMLIGRRRSYRVFRVPPPEN